MQAGNRGDADYPAPAARHHVIDYGARAVERALEIDGQHLVPFGLAHRRERGVMEHSGVAHHDVEMAEGLHRTLDHRVDFGERADVGANAGRAPPQLFDLGRNRRDPLDIAAVYHDVSALAREEQRGGTADSRTRPGDERDFSFQAHIVLHPSARRASNRRSQRRSGRERVESQDLLTPSRNAEQTGLLERGAGELD